MDHLHLPPALPLADSFIQKKHYVYTLCIERAMLYEHHHFLRCGVQRRETVQAYTEAGSSAEHPCGYMLVYPVEKTTQGKMVHPVQNPHRYSMELSAL